MERGHSVEGSFSREFSSTYMVRELSPSEVGSRSRGYQKSGFWGKTTHCGKTLKISFRKDSSRRRTTSCVQISWNLADRKSVKSCIISVTKQKNGLALPLSLLRGSRPKSVRASSRQYTWSAPNFIQIDFASGGVIAERVKSEPTQLGTVIEDFEHVLAPLNLLGVCVW